MLAQNAHAHFGIKFCANVPHREMVKGVVSAHDGLPGRKKACNFCAYDKDWDSWNHQRVWMASYPRYAKVRTAPDFDTALRYLVKSGYSESAYHGGKTLLKLAADYKLRVLDRISI